MSNPIAQQSMILIALILPKLQMVLGSVDKNLMFRGCQQRSNQ